MELKEFTTWLLGEKDPAKWIRMLDAYIQTFNKLGSATFVLPKDHNVLKPAMEAFVSDQVNFIAYIKAVRDLLEGGAKADMHGLYRTIMTRQLQYDRRERLNRALKVYEQTHKLEPHERQAYLKFLEQTWGVERLKFMQTHRFGKTRLTTDERNEVLQEFWQMIDERISRGDLPNGKHAPMES